MRSGVVTKFALIFALLFALLSLGSKPKLVPHTTLIDCRGPHIQLETAVGNSCFTFTQFFSMTHDAEAPDAATAHTIQLGSSADGGDLAPDSGNLLVGIQAVDGAASITAAGLSCGSGWTKVDAAKRGSGIVAAICTKVSAGTETTTTFGFDGGTSEETQSIFFQISGASSLTCATHGQATTNDPIIPSGSAGASDLTIHLVAQGNTFLTESDAHASMSGCTTGQMTARESSTTDGSGVLAAACVTSLGDTATQTWTALTTGAAHPWLAWNCWATP